MILNSDFASKISDPNKRIKDDLNLLHAKLFWGNINIYLHFFIISQHREHSACSWNLPLLGMGMELSSIVINIVAADDQDMPWTRASVAMVSRNILVLKPDKAVRLVCPYLSSQRHVFHKVWTSHLPTLLTWYYNTRGETIHRSSGASVNLGWRYGSWYAQGNNDMIQFYLLL